ncbi:hypothetical protein Cpir12675_005305 [Ceratocystis pirilliformis]|uniref:FHA domain-containing protein n=1 Tax=Ceratocystis pirilliformis TaxID=259994 RepID=A0ABR3YQV2_9PEZI
MDIADNPPSSRSPIQNRTFELKKQVDDRQSEVHSRRGRRDREHDSRSHRHRDSRSEQSNRHRHNSHERRHNRERDCGREDSRAHVSSLRRSRSRSPHSHSHRHRERDDAERKSHKTQREKRHSQNRDSSAEADRKDERSSDRKSGAISKRHRRSRRSSPSRSHSPGTKRPVSRNSAPANRTALPSQESSWAVTRGEAPPTEKEKPNFNTTGLLAAESNSVQQSDGTIIRLKYTEPTDACKPRKRSRESWKLFVFQDKQVLDTIPLVEKTAWLVGREGAVCDFPEAHASVSKQHAVFQFRLKEKRNEFGDREDTVKLYVIDLESSHGTKLNSETIPTSRYVELRSGDVIRLGKCSKEYVVMMA